MSNKKSENVNILVIHAYSTHNSGDGLLVDLTKKLIDISFDSDANIEVVALDRDSFKDRPYKVTQFPMDPKNPIGTLFYLAQILKSSLFKDKLMPGTSIRPDLVVAVGGGYMRSTSLLQSVKSFLSHGMQLLWATSSGIPTIYLPQSVGPLRCFGSTIIKNRIKKVSALYLRDDRSITELGGAGTRVPDLAVFEIAHRLSLLKADSINIGGPVLVARELACTSEIRKTYVDRLTKLMKHIDGLEPVVQSKGRGNDDPSFYSSIGLGDNFDTLINRARSETKPCLAISVRLHGALESIASGIPAIHLSYERKGYGAFTDLGIDEYVHNVFDFDENLVIEQAHAIMNDPENYWARIRKNIPYISEKYEEIASNMRGLVSK